MRAALAPLAVLLLALTGCDAGNREAPGSDNAFACPALSITAPYEGQAVVVSRAESPVLALIDLRGARLGRGAGSTLRYRLRPLAEGVPAEPAADGGWAPVADPAVAVPLGRLEAGEYLLEAEVLDKDGRAWAREEASPEGGTRLVNAASRAARRFRVAAGWARGS